VTAAAVGSTGCGDGQAACPRRSAATEWPIILEDPASAAFTLCVSDSFPENRRMKRPFGSGEAVNCRLQDHNPQAGGHAAWRRGAATASG
jgi:hypothetical protein